VKAATINGKRLRRGISQPPLTFLSLLLFKLALELLHFPLHSQHTNTRTQAPILFSAAASGSRRRREFVVAGEGLVPPHFLLDSWDRQGLIKLMLLQVPVLDARRCHAPLTGAPPDPPPLPSSLTGAFPSFLSSPPSSTHGEQKLLLDIPSF
jgi:hypothetical protein